MKKHTRQWVRKAESDLAVARHLFKLKPLPSDEICFHCQQALEKYFKGWLAEFALPVQKTHDLTILLQHLVQADATLRPLGRGLKGITRYAVEYRYPGMRANRRQARAAYERAITVSNEIRRRLRVAPKRRRT